MSRELIENLRDYADIAEAGEKSHWAKAMRQAAEYIRADLEKTLPEPFTYIVPSAFEKLSSGYAMSVFCTKQAINKSDIPLYAEPTANKREESYSDALRSLASYVGCGGYNADDPIDAKEFEERIRFGIDLMLSTAQSQPCVRKPLTDEQIIDLYFDGFSMGELLEFARAIEAAHGITDPEQSKPQSNAI
jgi:hypothetical protein